jgi:hypothetical protein
MAENIRRGCDAFLGLLPQDWREAIQDAADRVNKRVDASNFLRLRPPNPLAELATTAANPTAPT